MEVVEKIIKETKHKFYPLELRLCIPDIEQTYNTVVEYIKWYNQQTKEKETL